MPSSSSTTSPSSSSSFTHPCHLLRLPTNVIHHSILTFLPLRQKALEVARLCRSIPALVPACFSHDHLYLRIRKLRRAFPHWPSLPLVNSITSLWAESSVDDQTFGNEADTAKLIAFDLACISACRSVTALRLPWIERCRMRDGMGYISRLLTASTHQFSGVQSLCVQPQPNSNNPTHVSSRRLPLDDVEALCRLPALTQLSLRGFDIDPLCVQLLICALPNLNLLDLHECRWAGLGDTGSKVNTLRFDSPSPSLRTLLLPKHGAFQWRHWGVPCADSQHPVLAGLLNAALRTLAYLDTGDMEVSAALADAHSSSVTALHMECVSHSSTVLQNLHSDGAPHMPQLRHFSCEQSYALQLSADLYTSFLYAYSDQLHAIKLDCWSLQESISWVWAAIFSCHQLRSLSLDAWKVCERTVTSDDGTPAFPFRPSRLLMLHTLVLNVRATQGDNVDYATLSALLSQCPSLRHYTQTGPSRLLATRSLALAGQRCPHLVTTWLIGGDMLQPEQDAMFPPALSRPLFPALEAAVIVPNYLLHQRWGQPAQRIPTLLHYFSALTALLASQHAPRLQHVTLRTKQAPLDLDLLPLLRPLNTLTTLGGAVDGSKFPRSWLPYRWRAQPTSSIDVHRARMQRLFTQHVRDEKEMTVDEFVRRLAQHSSHSLRLTSLLHFANASAREAFLESLSTSVQAEPAMSSSSR